MNETASGAIEVPAALPPVLSLVCGVAVGLTAFGDAILFHVLWSLSCAVGLVPAGRRETLTKAVLYITIMAMVRLPLVLWVARHELKVSFIHGSIMAVPTIPAVLLGAWLLYTADLTALKLLVGSLFLAYSVV